MTKATNHTNVYELVFEDPKKLDFGALLKSILEYIKEGKDVTSFNGTYYIKSYRDLPNAYIFLFGKDNPDASNHKREKHKFNFDKLDIDEDKEVLTDFIHIGISKKVRKQKGKEVHTIFAEKSSLVRQGSIKGFIDHLTGDAFSTELRRRVLSKYYEAVRSSKRIISMTQVKKDIPFTLPGNQDAQDLEDITVEEKTIIKPNKRGGTIPFTIFSGSYDNMNFKDPSTALYVTIRDESNNEVDLDFAKPQIEYSVKFSIPVNKKEDDIQDDIAAQINKNIKLYEQGKI